MAFRSVSLLTLLALGAHVRAVSYTQSDSYIGADFINRFSFDTESDPTHGRVNYVDAATAASNNLTYASGNTFIARADYTTTLSASGAGRNSVRLQSNTYYSTGTVMVIDLNHMPEGCGTWPAIWTLGDNWPANGEIDIVEGVNNQAFNQATLHTEPGCTMPTTSRTETGTSLQTDCDTNANGNAGCGVAFASGSFGPTFNSNGGGWYAMERTADFIKVWYFARSGSVPSDISGGSSSINTDNWGTPVAYFPNTSCSITSLFGAHRIIINLTFCGDWAGSVYSTSGCPSTCVDYVNNNPSAFANAYFQLGSIRIYQ